MKIIAISGFIGAGKDTVANYLIKNYEFNRESLAKSLKDATATIFNWPRHLLEGDTDESRNWRETVDPWWSKKLKLPNATPRLILQLIGTEVFRNSFNQDIWTLSLENRLLSNKNSNIIITDCRFPNEIEIIRKLSGKLVWVKRGPLPEWYSMALDVNTNSPHLLEDFTKKYRVHQSEFRWIGTNFDIIINNDDSLSKLYDTIDTFMNSADWQK